MRLVLELEPAACRLLAQAGLSDVLPADVCAPPPQLCQPPPPSGPLFCGGSDGITCPDGLVCDRTDPLCTQSAIGGRCVAPSDTCVDDGHPVCGCDGQTYASDCARQKAAVVLARTGACDPPPSSCGPGLPDCPAGSFCNYPSGDCGEGGHGTCAPMRAEPCNLCTAFTGGPVCGCNLVTYASECDRAAAGVSKFFNGSCS